jgi:hypothetical protein
MSLMAGISAVMGHKTFAFGLHDGLPQPPHGGLRM